MVTSVAPLYEKYPESVQIRGDSFITKEEGIYVIKLHIHSNIKPLVTIYALEIPGVSVRINPSNASIEKIISGHAKLTSEGLTMTPGTDLWLIVRISSELNVGNLVEVKVYTDSGLLYKGMLSFK